MDATTPVVEYMRHGQARVLELLASGRSIEDVLVALARLLEAQMPGAWASVLLLDEDSAHLRHGAAPSLPETYVRAIDGVKIGPRCGSCGTAAYRARRVIVENIATSPLWADYRDLALKHGLCACWAQPVLSRIGRIVGTVAVYWHESPRQPTEAELELLEAAAHLAGIAIERKRFEEELHRAKEAAESASKAKDHFLAMLSHELRTPLSPVLPILATLERRDLPADIREDLATIRRSIDLETRLIDDLLDITRIERGKLELNLHPIDVHAKLQNVLRICQEELRQKGQRLLLELLAQKHRMMGDPARLQQVFWNLLRNAMKFTAEGGTIRICTADGPNGRMIVQVIDTGIGIESQMLPRLCKPFEQGEKSITRRHGGLGLGLAIAKAIVDMHGGTLRAASEGRGHGATFTVELPVSEVPTPVNGDATARNGHAQPRAAGRILLVEDHADTGRIMARLLRSCGYEVRLATTVAAALAVAEQEDFDLLISDIGLPDGSGLDLMRRLRQTRPIKGIALSGFGMEDDLRRSAAAGFLAHLTKPVDVQRLEEILRQAVKPSLT